MTSKVGDSKPFGFDIDVEQASKMIFQGAKGGLGVADGLVKSPNPIAMGINTVVGGLGLPPIVGEAAKVGVGIAMGDASMIVDGGIGLCSEGIKIAEPYVEYPTGNIHVGMNEKGEFGYSTNVDWQGAIPFHSKGELYVGDPTGVLDMFANMVGQSSQAATAAPGQAPHGASAIQSAAMGSAGPSGPAAQSGEVSPAAPGNGESPLAGDTLKYYDSLHVLLANYETFDVADPNSSGFYKADGGISYGDLQAFMDSPDPKVREAALFLLQNTEYFKRASGMDGKISQNELHAEIHKLDQAIKLYGPPTTKPSPPPGQGTSPVTEKPISPPKDANDLKKAEPAPVLTPANPGKAGPPEKVEQQPQPAPVSTSFLGSAIKSILNDPTLSTEEKIQRILQAIMESADAEELELVKQIGDTAVEIGKAQDSAHAAGGGGQEGIAKKQSQLSDLQLKLQKTVERRKQMFELMSNMSEKNNEMAKHAIQNLGRA